MIISREEIPTIQPLGLSSRSLRGNIDGKTLCGDEKACEVLNEILNGTPLPREHFPFTLVSNMTSVSITINTNRMAPGEIMELNLKLLRFLMSEIHDIRHGD